MVFLIGPMYSQCYAQDFEPFHFPFPIDPPTNARYEWVDADQDDDLDVLLFFHSSRGSEHSYIKLLENTGEAFREVPSPFDSKSIPSPERYTLKDYDRDGDTDVLISNDKKLYIARNEGDLSFTLEEVPNVVTQFYRASIYWEDIDGDGDLDIITNTGVYINKDDTYTLSIHRLSHRLKDLYWADVNQDGLLDFLGVEHHGDSFLFLNQGDAVFAKSDQAIFEDLPSGSVLAWQDLDADQDLDLVLTKGGLSHEVSTFQNQYAQTGKIEFNAAAILEKDARSRSRWGDLNHDGLPDIIIQHYRHKTTALYLNQSTSTRIDFKISPIAVDTEIDYLELIDIDQDDDLDVMYTARDYRSQLMPFAGLANQIADPGTTPIVPSSLSTEVTDHVTLRWEPIIDKGVVGYLVEMHRNGERVVSSQSTDQGKPTALRFPNALVVNHQHYYNLQVGNYTWRVQAVDASGRTSGFSAYHTFAIAAPPTDLRADQLDRRRVKISWADFSSATSYVVLRRSNHRPWEKIAEVSANPTEYIDHELLPDQQYEYMVKAKIDGALSAPSSVVHSYVTAFKKKPLTQQHIIDSYLMNSADLDSDGDYDLAFMGRIDYKLNQSFMLKNEGTDEFVAEALLPKINHSSYSSHLLVKDLDNDGDQDVGVVHGPTNAKSVVLFENLGDTLIERFRTQPYTSISQIALEDFNNDGRIDLLFSCAKHDVFDRQYILLWQKNKYSFEDSRYPFTPEYEELGKFVIGDVNGDSFLDILLSGNPRQYRKGKVFKNLNGSSFEPISVDLSTSAPVTFFDINQDHHLDIIYAYHRGIIVQSGRGDFTFQSSQDIELPQSQYSYPIRQILTADMDLNGLPDLLTSTEREMRLLQNTGLEGFIPSQYPFAEGKYSSVYLHDQEQDGDLDIVRLGDFRNHDRYNYILENTVSSRTASANVAPSSPTGLQAEITDNGKVILRWEPAQDDRTPACYISYNLWLTDSEGKVIFHPETNETGSFRRRSGPGNIGPHTYFTITQLPTGKYTARLQALDASYALSAFSPAITFEVLPGPTDLRLERQLLNKVHLCWTNPSPPAQELVIERQHITSDFEIIAELPPGASSFTDSLLEYNQVYSYRLRGRTKDQPTTSSNTVAWSTYLFRQNRRTGLPKAASGAIDVGDADQDGHMDILLSGRNRDYGYDGKWVDYLLKYKEAQWHSYWIPGVNNLVSKQRQWHDLNDDHHLDIFFHGFTSVSNYVTGVNCNIGSNIYEPINNIFTDNHYQIQTWWDYDSDNDLDAVVMEKPQQENFKINLIRREGDGNFSKVQEKVFNCYNSCNYQQVAVGDYDNDGDEDLLEYGYVSGKGSGYHLKLNVRGQLQDTPIILAGGYGFKVQVIDYNNDGWMDLFILGTNYYTSLSRLYKNLGTSEQGYPQFQLVIKDLPAATNIDSDWADYDHDGDLDFFISASPFRIYTNLGDDNFSERKISFLYTYGDNQARWIDVDQDGDLDIYYVGFRDRDVFDTTGLVLENQLIADGLGKMNKPPSPPTALTALQDEEGMHLSWSGAQDDICSVKGLTYDVLLYRMGKVIKKAPINPVSGYRQKLSLGRHTTRALLNNLEPGEYTWRVQAVDQGFLGSALSEARTFTFESDTTTLPGIQDTTVYRCGNDTALEATGETIEWFSDEALTHRIASGIFYPQESQVVYVTQSIDGIRGKARRVAVTVINRPDRPQVQQDNPYFYLPDSTQQTLLLNVKGEAVRWYADASLEELIAEGTSLTPVATPATYYVTQSQQGCESLPTKVVVQEAEPIFIPPTVPITRDSSVYTAVNAIFYFVPEHFFFRDADSTDQLAGVHIVQSVHRGEFFLDTNKNGVGENHELIKDEHYVTYAELAQLAFLPEEDASADFFTSFTFSVSDGMHVSEVHTMQIHVTPFSVQQEQIIHWEAFPDVWVEDTVVLTATASSGLPIHYSVEGPATLDNDLLIVKSQGEITVRAQQPGDSRYQAADPITYVFAARAREADRMVSQDIYWDRIQTLGVGDTLQLTAQASSGLPIHYSVEGTAFVTAGLLIAPEGGTIIITATQAGNEEYLSAEPISQTIRVTKEVVTAITELERNVVVYPNPVDNILVVVLDGPSWRDGQIIVSNLLGSKVAIVNRLNQKNYINLSAQPPGFYLVIIQNKNKLKTFPVLKR